MKWSTRISAAALVAFMAIPSQLVSAHASFVESDPIDGSVLATAPNEVTLRFDEAVLVEASSVRLITLGSDGDVVLDLTSPDDGFTVVARLPDIGRGGYIMRYVVLDPEDLHRTVGSISFGVGVSAPESSAEQQVAATPLATAGRIVADTALIGGGGAAMVLMLAIAGGLAEAARRRLATWAAAAAATLSVSWLLLLLDDLSRAGWSNVSFYSLMVGSGPGRRFLIGAQLTFGLLVLVRLRTRSGGRIGTAFVERSMAALWSGLVILAAVGGHASTGGDRYVGIALRVGHLVGLCVWIGVVAVTALLVRTGLVDDPKAAWRRSSSAATVGLALTGATGVLLTARVVETVTAMLTTATGRFLIAKIVALAVLAVVGSIVSRRVVMGVKRTGGLFGIEMAVAMCTVVLGVIVVGRPPARGEEFLPLAVAAPQVSTDEAGDLVVSASLEPAQPGPNLVVFRVLDTRRPAPGPVERLDVSVINAAGETIAEVTGTPTDGVIEWRDLSLPGPGSYRVEAAIDRPALGVPSFSATWVVSSTPVPRVPTVISSARLAGLAWPASAAWALIVGAGALRLRSRRVS